MTQAQIPTIHPGHPMICVVDDNTSLLHCFFMLGTVLISIYCKINYHLFFQMYFIVIFILYLFPLRCLLNLECPLKYVEGLNRHIKQEKKGNHKIEIEITKVTRCSPDSRNMNTFALIKGQLPPLCRVGSQLQLGLLTPSCHDLFPSLEGQSSLNPAALLVARAQRINHCCPVHRHEAVDKFKRSPRCCPQRESKVKPVLLG